MTYGDPPYDSIWNDVFGFAPRTGRWIIGDARGLSEEELRLWDAQRAWAYANAEPSWIGLENYYPRLVYPPAPQGWQDWFAIGDELR